MEDIWLAFGLLDRLYNNDSFPTQITGLEPKHQTYIPRPNPNPIQIRPRTPKELPPFDEPSFPQPRPDFQIISKYDRDGNNKENLNNKKEKTSFYKQN